MWLILAAPLVAGRSCDDCTRHIYNEDTGQRELKGGLPIVRPKGTKPPCGYTGPAAKGCPKGSPDAGRELTEQNALAYQHYRECKAVGRFPDDATVARNAGIISNVTETWERMENRMLKELMMAMCGMGQMR